jgi:LuxR family transcriptional regulator, maltose regulon positive regulatory protein
VERLQGGLSGPLTLISAPAGSGKTTLLSQWRLGVGANLPAAWLSLDPADNDLARFLQYLSAALETVQPGLAEEVSPLLQASDRPNWEAVLTALINRLSALPNEAVLALDDYHLIDTPAIHAALAFLLDHLPQSLHLVVITRADPPLPLSRLRAGGKMTELRAEHLRFSTDEASQFLNQIMGLNLSCEQVAALEKRTEGWIAGLQLAALSMQGREDVQGFVSAFTGSHHYIVDYLVEEVLSRQPEALRDFLLRTSILERFTGALCDALTGEENGEAVLEGLEHANLFVVPLDDDQRWYRYHLLFGDLLHSRLLHSTPQLAPQLHIRASTWFEANGFVNEAIHHALEAKDFERAARLFCQDHMRILSTHSIDVLDRWLQSFPEDFLRLNPWLCIARTHILWSVGRRDELEPYISNAEAALDRMLQAGQISADDPDYLILRGDTYSFRALITRGENQLDLALEFSRKAVQTIPYSARSRVFALGSLYWIYQVTGDIDQAIEACLEAISAGRSLNYPSMTMTATYTLAQMLRIQGRLHQSAQVLHDALVFAKAHRQARLSYCGILHIGLAETLYEWNALNDVEAELQTGVDLCRQGGMSVLVELGLLNQVQLKYARGDRSGALQILDENQANWHAYRENVELLRLRWRAEQGELSGLADWVGRVDLSVGKKVGVSRFFQLSYAVFFLSLLDRNQEAMEILECLQRAAQAAGLSGWLVSVLVLQSVVWGKLHNEARALDCLRQALDLAQPEGYVRVFLNRGQPVHELLRLYQKRNGGSEFLSRLLAAFDQRSTGQPEAALKQGVLSKREVELLRLVAAGCSNKEIACQLVISVGTVKRHVINIFNKLDVKNRTEAVARARELKLL